MNMTRVRITFGADVLPEQADTVSDWLLNAASPIPGVEEPTITVLPSFRGLVNVLLDFYCDAPEDVHISAVPVFVTVEDAIEQAVPDFIRFFSAAMHRA